MSDSGEQLEVFSNKRCGFSREAARRGASSDKNFKSVVCTL